MEWTAEARCDKTTNAASLKSEDRKMADGNGITLFSSSGKKRPVNQPLSNQQAQSLEAAPTGHSFASLGIDTWICNTLKRLGISSPTPVQQECIPATLNGRDVISSAPTGSGKTAAFALPILQHLSTDPFGVFALVLTPSRELSLQIKEQFEAFGSDMGVRVALIVGGTDFIYNTEALLKKPHVVIATPGRLSHILKLNGGIGAESRLSQVFKFLRYLVLDEADRLLELTFAPDIKNILDCLPDTRQTLLYSATMTANIEKAAQLTSDALRYRGPDTTTVPKLTQQYLFIPRQVKLVYLWYLIRTLRLSALEPFQENESVPSELQNMNCKSAIIFTATCWSCQLVHETLTELGALCVPLHSVMSQRRRQASLGKFRSHLVNVLVATDVASRGLDIPDVDIVINFDVPRLPSDYVHRVGRTARAGRSGRALTMISQYDVELVAAIEAKTGVKLSELPGLVEDTVLALLTRVSTCSRVAKLRMYETGFEDLLAKAKQRKRKAQEAQKEFVADDINDDEHEKEDLTSISAALPSTTAEAASSVPIPREQAPTNVSPRKKRRT